MKERTYGWYPSAKDVYTTNRSIYTPYQQECLYKFKDTMYDTKQIAPPSPLLVVRGYSPDASWSPEQSRSRSPTRDQVFVLKSRRSKHHVPKYKLIPTLKLPTPTQCWGTKLSETPYTPALPTDNPQESHTSSRTSVRISWPIAHAAKSYRITSQASNRSRPVSQASDRSRPTSQASDRPRPATHASDRSRPATHVSDRSRPASQASNRPRPASCTPRRSSVAFDTARPCSQGTNTTKPPCTPTPGVHGLNSARPIPQAPCSPESVTRVLNWPKPTARELVTPKPQVTADSARKGSVEGGSSKRERVKSAVLPRDKTSPPQRNIKSAGSSTRIPVSVSLQDPATPGGEIASSTSTPHKTQRYSETCDLEDSLRVQTSGAVNADEISNEELDYDAAREKYGWYAEIQGDPLGLKKLPRRPVYTVQCETPVVAPEPPRVHIENKDMFFYNTIPRNPGSFTVHTEWFSEVLQAKRMELQKKEGVNYRWRNYAFAY
ncbi:uncharacterized protein LOC121369276 [Gigantopelta aegis]|uniref:uncharacterized protein LOC121369276 n=1 Tax=Gigantopelta aegis TaxID=1735272 RepID=UPI001B88B26D|nr:uncharacterized protein LOC121369276 [Gigantopelta aegis]